MPIHLSFSCEIPGFYANNSHLFFLRLSIVSLYFNIFLVLLNAFRTLFSSFLCPAVWDFATGASIKCLSGAVKARAK